MLRLLVLILIFCNVLYFSWSQGLFRAYGFAPRMQSEPYRLAQQIRPEAVTLLSQKELEQIEVQALSQNQPKLALSPTPESPVCLQAGPFTNAQLDVLRTALSKTLAPQAWQLQTLSVSDRWIIYMGKYPNAATLQKKRREVLAMKLRVENLVDPALEPGFSLGHFPSSEAANAELARLRQVGIRSAHVVQEHGTNQALTMLKLPVVNETLRNQLPAFEPALAGKPLTTCN